MMGRSDERHAARVEELIQRHRPRVEQEQMPASPIQLEHLNGHGLLEIALARQDDWNLEHEVSGGDVVVSRIVAWEVLADAQRRGVRIEPRRVKV